MVELLVVLTIMGILSALAVTSVSSLRSTALAATGNQMVDVFAMARQNATSKSDYTAVVILKSGNSACSAYCLIELPNQSDGSRGTTWNQLSPWKYLPKGVVFENAATTDDSFMSSSLWTSPTPALPAANSSSLTSFPFQGSSVNLTTQAIIECFQPDGTLLGQQGSMALTLIPGSSDTSGTTTPRTNDYYEIYFVANTGTTKIGRP